MVVTSPGHNAVREALMMSYQRRRRSPEFRSPSSWS